VVRGGDAARGGGAGAAAAPLPPVDGAPGAETVHGAGSPVGSGPPGGRGAEMARRGGVGGRVGESTLPTPVEFSVFFFLLTVYPSCFVKFELHVNVNISTKANIFPFSFRGMECQCIA
jgi:hypothetical protein